MLKADNWRVTLDCIETSRDLENKLSSSGGYAITHIGKIERIDESEFEVTEAKNLLDALHYFFSFVRGIWSTPILPVGSNNLPPEEQIIN